MPVLNKKEKKKVSKDIDDLIELQRELMKRIWNITDVHHTRQANSYFESYSFPLTEESKQEIFDMADYNCEPEEVMNLIEAWLEAK